MSNQLEKLKNSIKKEYVNDFELNLMKSSGFIPVDKRQKDFFVILNKNSIANKAQIEDIIKSKYAGLTPKFIQIPAGDFEEVFTALQANDKQEPVLSDDNNAEQVSSSAEPTAEEMLVSIGWLTPEQLKECSQLAHSKNVPLDAIFYEKEYLSYDRIVSYLKKKYNCNVVSKSNIIVDKSLLKLLPDDFLCWIPSLF